MSNKHPPRPHPKSHQRSGRLKGPLPKILKHAIPHPENSTGELRGIFKSHPRGFGFVTPIKGEKHQEDIFIPKPFVGGAIDSDTVKVSFSPSSRGGSKGPEGRVLEILKRGRTHLAGTITEILENGVALLYVPILGSDIQIQVKPSKERKLGEGDRILARIETWGETMGETLCSLDTYIGHISDSTVDVHATALEFGIKEAFPKEVLEEALRFGSEVKETDKVGREDFTNLTTITIDPETAKDFDDALSLEISPDGHAHLYVHIADVAHYVKTGTALDKEAFLRANSTYFPGTCLPMLPHELSNELCSLKPNVVRCTATVVMHFGPTGELLDSRISRSIIKSVRRYTYEEAMAIIDGKMESEHSQLIQNMAHLGRALKRMRTDRGSVDMALPELVIVIDKDGNPNGTKLVEYDISHALVEEFMLKANEVVAKTISDKKRELIFRVHEHPDEDAKKAFSQFAESLGYRMPKEATSADIQDLFDTALQTPMGKYIAREYIRSMKMAIYSKENVGHYGLSLEYYCHFTSPIRRYSDLIIQRILFDEKMDTTCLDEVSRNCSEKERTSMRAEMHVKGLKINRFLSKKLEEDPAQIYSGIITVAKNFGIAFELADLPIEGSIHISSLGKDYFVYDPKRSQLVGTGTGKKYCISDPISIKLKSVDLTKSESQWEIADLPTLAKRTHKRSK